MTRHKFKLKDLNLSLFQGIEPVYLQRWEQIATVYQLDVGDKLYTQGEPATSFYIILEGGVRLVEYTASGKAVAIKVYGIGDMIGLLSISQEHMHAASVEAVDDTRIVAFRSSEARQLMEQNGTVAIRLVDHLTNHVHHAHDRIRHLAAEKTERRLACALLHFHRKFGEVQDGIYVINAELSQRDISEFTGTTIETVNRYLRNWEKQGIIQLSWKHIDILQPEALETISASTGIAYMPE